MDIIGIVNESKKRTSLMNNIGISWSYAQQLIPKVLTDCKSKSPEFINEVNSLNALLNDMEESIAQLKSLMPTNTE